MDRWSDDGSRRGELRLRRRRLLALGAVGLAGDDSGLRFACQPIEPRVFASQLTWVSANSNWYTLRNAGLS